MEKQDSKKDFKCRVCGHNEYEEVLKNNGILGPGGNSWRVYCVCKGCSTVFTDPERFSTATQE